MRRPKIPLTYTRWGRWDGLNRYTGCGVLVRGYKEGRRDVFSLSGICKKKLDAAGGAHGKRVGLILGVEFVGKRARVPPRVFAGTSNVVCLAHALGVL